MQRSSLSCRKLWGSETWSGRLSCRQPALRATFHPSESVRAGLPSDALASGRGSLHSGGPWQSRGAWAGHLVIFLPRSASHVIFLKEKWV